MFITDEARWRAVLENDRHWDGVFFYAVCSTGIFCRPSCPSRPPRRERVRFFDTGEQAARAGYRPCKRCRPDLACYQPDRETAVKTMEALRQHYRDPDALRQALDGLGVSRRRLMDLFRAEYGATIGTCLADLRLSRAQALLRDSDLPMLEVSAESGFPSPSTFYRVFRRKCGCAPSEYREKWRKLP